MTTPKKGRGPSAAVGAVWSFTSTLEYDHKPIHNGPYYFPTEEAALHCACKFLLEELESGSWNEGNREVLDAIIREGPHRLTDYLWLWKMVERHACFCKSGGAEYQDDVSLVEFTVEDDEWQQEAWARLREEQPIAKPEEHESSSEEEDTDE